MRNPGTAAVLSLIVPGLGQLYNGTWVRAIFWFIVRFVLFVGTGGLFGWSTHIIAAITAYNYARRHPHPEFDPVR